MLIGDGNYRLVKVQPSTASSSSAPSDAPIGAAVDDEPSSSTTASSMRDSTSTCNSTNVMERRHPASSRSRVQRPTTTKSRRGNRRYKPTSFASIVISSLAIVFIAISQSSRASLLQGCNFDESLCDQGEICIPDGLFGQCYSDEESELLKPLVVDRPLDVFQQELLRLELTRLADNALNWPHARSQCVLAYFKLTVVYALDYDTEFCSAQNPNNIWALIQEVQNVLATEREEEAERELLRQTLIRNGVQVIGDRRRDDDVNNNFGGDNADDLRELFLKLHQPVDDADAVAEKDTTDGAAEEPTLTNAEDGAGYGEEQQLQQLRQEKRSIDSNEEEEDQQQQQQQEQEQQPFESQQMPVALEEDVDNSAVAVPQHVVELGGDDDAATAGTSDQVVPVSVDLASKPATTLSVELLALDGAERNAIPQLDKADEQLVDAYVDDMLHNREPHLRALNEHQFQKLAAFVNQMRDILLSAVDNAAVKALNTEERGGDVGGAEDTSNNDSVSAPEVEEVVPLTSANNQQQLLLKKDAEAFHNDDMGLSKTVHKIVKGGVERVEGDRVYLKMLDNERLDETQLYRLINYLDRQIAQPNQLFFDEFKYANGQLSFRISRLRFVNDLNQLFSDAVESAAKEADAKEGGGGKQPTIDNASGVAEAVYKRQKDIQTLSGVEVDETGIGSGANIVPVESAKHEWFFVPVVAVCALTILSLIGVLAVQIFRRDGGQARCGRGAGDGADDASSRIAKTLQNANLPEVIDHYEGKPSSIYQDLCRQRMLASQDLPVGVSVVGGEQRATLSKHSSTSSWPDESVLQSSNLDISTGHVIMAFLKEYLEKPDEISAQWSQLSAYENANACTSIAGRAENASKNLDGSVLPYDDSLVTLQQPQRNNTAADATIITVDTDAEAARYVNASRIYDADPRQVAYIAAQSPCAESVTDFWQMVWEQGVVLVVNLCEASELRDHASRMAKYWPDEGSKVFDTFEINLVSEHIWSEDYVVRSLYLKNLATRETRTVTQFHYLTWPAGGVPHSIKSLLEFRRKVNKSYRGHASPVLIHCTNGSGRTGTYCLIDVVMNRILKGVKELNVAGSLEHLRDQRAKMVENQAQYTFVFQCVADEVSSLLKNLQH